MSNKIFGTGSGKNVLGHPLKALMWLANSLISRGRTLKSGDIIMTGTPKNAENSLISDGDEVKICIENIGELSNKVNSKKRI